VPYKGAQQRACAAKREADKKAGRPQQWKCHDGHDTKQKPKPKKK